MTQMSRRLLSLCLILMPALFAQDNPETLLARFKEKIRQDLTQVPNYTCLETLERWQKARKSRLELVDTVRFEVSSVGGREEYAWPGARQFEDKDLNSFIANGGATADGMFARLANDLFVQGKGTLEYGGEITYIEPDDKSARHTIRYDYQMPQSDSELVLRINSISAKVAYKGSFLFDPASLDLVTLSMQGDNIPKSLDLESAELSVEYRRVRIGNSGALLPWSGSMTLTHPSGAASSNGIRFSSCHAYQTQSTISFDAPAEAKPEAVQPALEEVTLPPGLLVPVVLESGIDSKTAAVGDPMRAKVRQDVVSKGQVVVPAGAVINGRIRKLERQAVGAPYFLVGVELSEVAWQNKHADFYGELVESDHKKGFAMGYAMRGSLTFTIPGKSFHIDSGLGLLWRVLDRSATPPEQPR